MLIRAASTSAHWYPNVRSIDASLSAIAHGYEGHQDCGGGEHVPSVGYEGQTAG